MSDAPALEPVENRLLLLVLQHPQERREPLATAALAVSALRRAKLVAGLSWPNLSRALGRRAEAGRWGVLYLGSARPRSLAEKRQVIVVGRGGEPVQDQDAVLANLQGVVILDGTWSQAKTLWWRNPWLLKLHRMVLNPPLPARLDRVRREPRREALSTIEAAALVLRAAEATPVAADALLAALDGLMARAAPQVSA